MTRVKICGLTSADDVRAAAAAGADALGFVFAPSPRRVTAAQARAAAQAAPPFVARVGVFVDATLDDIDEASREAGLHVIQLHGREDPAFVQAVRTRTGLPVVKAVAVRDEAAVADLHAWPADALLLDAYDPVLAGGTGAVFDWRLARLAIARLQVRRCSTPVILAGGLNPGNVQDAIRAVNPYAVDVSSGVERAPGKKCPDKIAEFIQKARA